MASYYVKYYGTNLKILKPIQLDYQLNRQSKQLVNASGSYTKYMGGGGRLISFTALARGSRIKKILKLKDIKKAAVLISPSQAKYNGKYHIIKFGPIEEYEKGSFKIPMKLQEDFKFNVVKKNFTNYQVKPKTSTNTTPKKYGVTLNCTGIWLENGSTGTLVTNLQKLLQIRGYYLKQPLDGKYGPVTTAAVKSFQRSRGNLKVDGIVGSYTCKALQS